MGRRYEDDKAEFLINTFELKIVFPICLEFSGQFFSA